MMQSSWPIKLGRSGKSKKQDIQGTVRKTGNKKRGKKLFEIAKQRNRQSKDGQQVRVIKSKTGEMLMEEEKVKQRWKEYFDNLLNQEIPRERREMRTGEREREGRGRDL